MSKQIVFSVLKDMPASVGGGMHPETKRIIDQIRSTKGGVLEVKLESARDAKNRMDALRRARAKNRVSFREAHRKGATIYVKVK